jgi:hypothetical protein
VDHWGQENGPKEIMLKVKEISIGQVAPIPNQTAKFYLYLKKVADI